MNATSICEGMLLRRLRSIVVLPVPTSPEIKTNPPCDKPYNKCDSASLWLSLRNKNSGSGAIENGSRERLK